MHFCTIEIASYWASFYHSHTLQNSRYVQAPSSSQPLRFALGNAVEEPPQLHEQEANAWVQAKSRIHAPVRVPRGLLAPTCTDLYLRRGGRRGVSAARRGALAREAGPQAGRCGYRAARARATVTAGNAGAGVAAAWHTSSCVDAVEAAPRPRERNKRCKRRPADAREAVR